MGIQIENKIHKKYNIIIEDLDRMNLEISSLREDIFKLENSHSFFDESN